MGNPWETINLSDYEKHMSLESVYQLQALNEMMKEQLDAFEADTVMILGIAGGNGLEHIRKEKVNKVYGVDVNPAYLAECEKRYRELQGILEPVCVDLLSEKIKLPTAKVLIANLLIEYIGYECFKRVVRQVKPEYISCIIQINEEETFVSDSPYIHVFDCLEAVHHQMEAERLTKCMQEASYEKRGTTERVLPNGKKLVRIDFKEF